MSTKTNQIDATDADAMSNVDDFLAHYGVKGMKWDKSKLEPQGPGDGGRVPFKSPTNSNSSLVKNAIRPKGGVVQAPSGASKGDVEWAKKAASAEKLQQVAAKSHAEFREKFREMLNDPKFADVKEQILKRRENPGAAQDPKVKAFFRQAKKAHDAIWDKHSRDILGKTPSKKFDLVAVRHPDGTITSKLVKSSSTGAAFQKAAPKGLTKAVNSGGSDGGRINKPNKPPTKTVKPPKGRPLVHNDESADSLSHKEDMLQDIIDGMTSVQRETFDLVIGAAIEDVDISDTDEAQQYDSLSDMQKLLIDFVVGAALSDGNVVKHEDEVDDFLAHHGVKGMRWGIRKDQRGGGAPGLSKTTKNSPAARKIARQKVREGKATLADAHLAALKSTGHRVANAILGDKTYWKKAAIIGGASIVGVGASIAAPALLPTSVLVAIGGGTHVALAGGGSVTLTSAAAANIGASIVTNTGIAATTAISGVASTVTQVTNLGRAIRGNARVNKSYAALGSAARKRQTAGNERTRKVLNKQGGLRKKDLVKHSENMEQVGDFLAHFGIKGMRWGFRRQRGPDGTVGGNPENHGANGTSKPVEGHATGGAHSDHDLLVRALKEGPNKLSTAELRSANDRAMQLQAYNRMLDPKAQGHAELQRRVEALRLQKEHATLRSQMKPPSNFERFMGKAKTGWNTYRQLDKLSGGALSKKVGTKLGLLKESEIDILKKATAGLEAKRKNVKAQAELEDLKRKYPHLFI